MLLPPGARSAHHPLTLSPCHFPAVRLCSFLPACSSHSRKSCSLGCTYTRPIMRQWPQPHSSAQAISQISNLSTGSPLSVRPMPSSHIWPLPLFTFTVFSLVGVNQ